MHEMTTAALQRIYPSVYEEFYREHDLVLTLPMQFRWVHDLPMWSDSLLIKQQLPTSIFLWLTPQRRPGVFFWSAIVFDRIDWFVKQPIHEVISKEKIISFQQQVEQLLAANGYKGWVAIDILSEQPKWYWFGFMWIVCTALACAVYLLTGKLLKEQVENTVWLPPELLKELVDLAVQIDIGCGWSPTGISAHLALTKISEPVVQFGSATTLTLWGIQLCPNHKNEIHRLSEIFDVDEEISLPIDFGIISLGIGCDENEMKLSALHSAYSYKEIFQYRSYMKQKLNLPMDMPDSLPMSMVIKPLKISFLQHRERMLKNSMNTVFVEAFIQSVMHLGTHAVILEKQEQQLTDLYTQFHLLKKLPSETIWLAPMSTIKAWWLVLFVCHKAQSRQTIAHMVEWLREQGYDDVDCTYLSWRDGRGWSGLKIEQWLSQGVYSSFVPKWSKLIISATWIHEVLDGQTYIEDHTMEWIILDTTTGKVHLPHTKITHKDLPSQPSTTEIIGKLVESSGKFIHNSDFSCSSYSKNKNEMMGKIIQPMVRLVRSHFGKEIEIECKGSLFDFSLRLADDKGMFRIVKQLGK